jgi:hypothetical protein
MKKKKVKKIAKKLYKQITNYKGDLRPIKESINYCDYDSEVSEKFKKLILCIIEYKDNININVSTDSFSISIPDISLIKKPTQKGRLYNDDNYLEIVVNKSEGFSINQGYSKRSNYKDIKIFNELHSIVNKRLKEINGENFGEILENILKESGIMRDNNLEELLNG